jgi:hypothetical protein
MGLLLGCDFSSSPSRRKQIVCTLGTQSSGRVVVQTLERFDSIDAFSRFLRQHPAWIGAFDLPFGLPRELVLSLGWPEDWEDCVRHYAGLSRDEIRSLFSAFCDERPVGSKFAHRATDRPAQSSPSMKWVNPPVAFMLHAGVPCLLDAGAYFPGLQAGRPDAPGGGRIALEAYPGLIAKAVLGSRSYKSDDRVKQTPERLIARKDLLHALETGQTRWGLRLKLSHAQHEMLVDDASGDALDAVLCLVLAAWGEVQHQKGDPFYGLPPTMDSLEGWILSA